MKRRYRKWASTAALLVPILLLGDNLFARAGGGGGFHGGGGGGGGGDGGGGGGGGLVFWILFQLLRLCYENPVVGIPLTACIIFFVFLVQRKANKLYRSNVIGRGAVLLDHGAREMLLAKVRQADPAFNHDAFFTRVTSAFIKIQNAWANQKLQAVRPFISDGVFERFNLQFDEQKMLGYRNAMEGVDVNSVAIAAFLPDRIFDQLSLRFEASASDYNVSLKDGSRIRGSDDSGDFVEIWSFLRRHGVQTSNKDGLIEGNCPNCGAAIEINQNANCAHCGAMLRSGQYDWVLVEITQGSEWSDSAAQLNPSSFAPLLERDPDFNLQDLEDRASVMFWRRTAAERLGDVRPMRKIASAEFCDAYAAELRTRDTAGRAYYGECAVGAVDSLGLISDDAWDRALVEVKWEGKKFIAGNNGAPPQRTDQATNTRIVLELSRRANVKSDPGKAISSAHCPNCGAPESGKDDRVTGACEFCGAVLNDGTRGWVLTAVRSPAEARQMLASVISNQSPDSQPAPGEGDNGIAASIPPATALAWMIELAVADGEVDPHEMELLSRVAARRNIPQAQLDNLIASAKRGAMDLPSPASTSEAQQWITALVQTALADGRIAPEELKVITAAARRAGMGDLDVRMLMNRVRSDVYTAAKSALRDAKGS